MKLFVPFVLVFGLIAGLSCSSDESVKAASMTTSAEAPAATDGSDTVDLTMQSDLDGLEERIQELEDQLANLPAGPAGPQGPAGPSGESLNGTTIIEKYEWGPSAYYGALAAGVLVIGILSYTAYKMSDKEEERAMRAGTKEGQEAARRRDGRRQGLEPRRKKRRTRGEKGRGRIISLW